MSDDLRDRAALYVLGQLPPDERLGFESAMDADRELAAYTRSLDEAYAQRIRALPQLGPPARLLGRIESQIGRGAAAPVPQARPGGARTLWWLSAAAAAALALGGAFYAGRRTARPRLPLAVLVRLAPDSGTATTVQLHDPVGDDNGRFVELAGMAEALWQKPHEDYALYDPTTRQGFVGIRRLPPGPARTRYSLWLLDGASGRIRFAGEIPGDATKGGLFAFSVDSGAVTDAADVRFFVTADGPGAALNPDTGRVVLGQRHS
ncbi:MAG TPA: hypothetical protein VGG34_07315 [Opitutaceae bacterium]|jgi:hypothetical protein